MVNPLVARGIVLDGDKREEDEDNVGRDMEYRALGVVFVSRDDPDFMDLHETKFLPDVTLMRNATDAPDAIVGTDYGVDNWLTAGKSIPVMWDHGRGVLGSKVIGEASFQKVTDEGLEFIIKVVAKQAGEYQKLIDYVYKRNLLGVSSQTLASVADFDHSTGVVRRWYPAEMTLTVVPSDHRTRQHIVEYARTIGITDLGEDFMDDKNIQDEDVEVAPVTTPEEIARNLVAGIGERLDEAEEVGMTEAVYEHMRTVAGRLDTLEAATADIATKEDIAAVRTAVEELKNHFTDVLRAFSVDLGDLIGARVQRAALETFDTSRSEATSTLRAAQPRQSGRSGNGLPMNMPGNS